MKKLDDKKKQFKKYRIIKGVVIASILTSIPYYYMNALYYFNRYDISSGLIFLCSTWIILWFSTYIYFSYKANVKFKNYKINKERDRAIEEIEAELNSLNLFVENITKDFESYFGVK
jgi:hypothetical protein